MPYILYYIIYHIFYQYIIDSIVFTVEVVGWSPVRKAQNFFRSKRQPETLGICLILLERSNAWHLILLERSNAWQGNSTLYY